MGLFTRALAGAGEGASQVASKYIDEQLAEQRAQVLADIQRNSAVQMDQYTNSPERRATMADLAGKDIVANAGATDTASLNTATNIPLMQAAIDRKNQVTAGTMGMDAAAAGMHAGALEAVKPHEVPPGGDLVVNGISIFENKRMTPGEASLAAYREGFKHQGAQDRDRVTELTITSIAKRLDDNQKDLDKLLSDNPDAMTPPAPESHWFGEDTPGKEKPAYKNYQRLMRERAGLAADFQAITSRVAKGGDAPAPRGADPLGIFGGNAKLGESAGPKGDGSAERRAMGTIPGTLPDQQPDTGEGSQAGAIAALDRELARPGLSRDQRAVLQAERDNVEAGRGSSTTTPGAAAPAAPAAPAAAEDKYAARLRELQAKPPAATKSIMAKVSPEAEIERQLNAMPGEPREEVNGQPNPRYADWQRTYGERFNELRRQLEAIRSGNASAFEARFQKFKEQEARGGR